MISAKKLFFPVIILTTGVAVGGSAGYAATLLLGPSNAQAKQVEETTFVDVDNVLAPLVLPDGKRLAGYVSFQVALEVPVDHAEDISSRVPLLRHEINMRTYRRPMASGPDGTLPTLEVFRKIVEESSEIVFGKGAVRKIAIASATPA